MSGMGYKQHIWNKELDNKLLKEIFKGASYTELTITMNMSYASIMKRLKSMGFDGLKDARLVMTEQNRLDCVFVSREKHT